MSNPTKHFKAAVIQLKASEHIQTDIESALNLMEHALEAGAELISLPEICAGLDQRAPRPVTIALGEEEHPALAAFRAFAKNNSVQVLIGSLGILENQETYNRSFLLDQTGDIVARYDKLHLFDINLGGDVWFKESDTFAPGEHAVLAPCMGAFAGLSICYDLRFPQLYRAYAQSGASLLFVPAAFTRPTGRAHWHSLLRARAIENGAWIIAPAQHGDENGGCYGHSLIIDPWGTIQAECSEDQGFAIADIDLSMVEQTRAKIPSLQNEREFTLNLETSVERNKQRT